MLQLNEELIKERFTKKDGQFDDELFAFESAIERYNEIKLLEEELKAEKNQLKDLICAYMAAKNLTKYSNVNNVEASISNKTSFTYVDELAMIKYLQENGYTNFIKTVIDTTGLNKELKKGSTLAENLKTYYAPNTSQSLSVK